LLKEGTEVANLIFTLLILAAVAICLLTVGMLLLWLWGADSLAFPGLGLLVATPVFVLLLTLLQLIVVVAAIFAARYKAGMPTIMST
jgi:hypothetical protein